MSWCVGKHHVLTITSYIDERCQEFAYNVSWQKIDERTGAEIPDEDIIDGGGDEPTPNGGVDDEPMEL